MNLYTDVYICCGVCVFYGFDFVTHVYLYQSNNVATKFNSGRIQTGADACLLFRVFPLLCFFFVMRCRCIFCNSGGGGGGRSSGGGDGCSKHGGGGDGKMCVSFLHCFVSSAI